MSAFTPVSHDSLTWEKNVLGSEVTRLRTDGAMLTVVHGRAGDVGGTVVRDGTAVDNGVARFVLDGVRFDRDREIGCLGNMPTRGTQTLGRSTLG